MAEVECDIEFVEIWSDERGHDVPSVRATCSRCGHETESFGEGVASIRRCLVMMCEECPLGESNYYTEGSHTYGASQREPEGAVEERERAPAITSFEGKYRFLSNFSTAPVPYDGYVYPTSEHAFQAAKVGGSSNEIAVFRQEIRAATTPALAKRLGRRAMLRLDWEQIKVGVMLQIVLTKFAVSPELRRKLLETRGRELIEGNTWGDRTWGMVWQGEGAGQDGKAVGKWEGENLLGKILMSVRQHLS